MATPKNAAEGATFSAAVLPLVHDCNAASAAVVSDNLKFGLFPTGGDAVTARYSDFAAVKAAFEDVYACLGITCAQVGGLTLLLQHARLHLERCSDAMRRCCEAGTCNQLRRRAPEKPGL